MLEYSNRLDVIRGQGPTNWFADGDDGCARPLPISEALQESLRCDVPESKANSWRERRPGRRSVIPLLLLASIGLNAWLLVARWNVVVSESDQDAPVLFASLDPVPDEQLSHGAESIEPNGLSQEPSLNTAFAMPTLADPPLPYQDGSRVVQAALVNNIAQTFGSVAGEDADPLSAAFSRLFMWDLDARRDLRAGDALAVAYRVSAGGELVVDVAQYDSLRLGTTLTAYRWHASGDEYPSYWAADGTEVARRLEDGPLRSYEQITSLLGDRVGHDGIDFKTATGTPIYSPWDGRVTRTNWNWTFNGNCIEVAYDGNILAKFLHLSEVNVEPGDRVTAGQVIGLTGNTGRTTGPHLHYQLNRGDDVLDPFDVHGTVRRSLPGEDRIAFAEHMREMDALMSP